MVAANEARAETIETDYAVAPGEILEGELEALGLTQADLARSMGRPKKTINRIIKGKAAITPETAIQLERVLGIPARLWNNLQKQYEQDLARLREKKDLKTKVGWLDGFPIAAMAKNGWLPKASSKVDVLRNLLRFLAIASPEQWEEVTNTRFDAAYRKSAKYDMDWNAVAVWLRVGEIRAQAMQCEPYSKEGFREVLREARGLTRQGVRVFTTSLTEKCAAAGVAVVLVKELPKIRLSGATRWLPNDVPLIQLSLRYKSDDQLWFTFFHEAGHILYHNKTEVFLEEAEDDGGDERKHAGEEQKEKDADEFAAAFLIPPNDYRPFVQRASFTYRAVESFAATIGIAPSIVVGRLQYDGHIPRSHLNKMKSRVDWS